MNFAFPGAGWFLAIAGPVILLYLIRQQPRFRRVGTVLFWDQLQPTLHNTPFWRRLRRLLSLLLQLLFIVLLVLALSRPLLPWQSSTAVSRVLIIDPSVSMTATTSEATTSGETGNGVGSATESSRAEESERPDEGESLQVIASTKTRWQVAFDKAGAQINSLRFFDEMAIIVADNPPRVASAWSNRKDDLRAALEAIRPVTSATDVRAALALARSLTSGRENPRIDVLTDGVWEAAPAEEALRGATLHRIGEPGEPNAGLVLFSARRSLASPGEYALALRIASNRAEPIKGEVEILRDGQLADVFPLELKPNEVWRRDWVAQGLDGARFEVRLKGVADDALPADNIAAAELGELRPLRVVLISEPYAFLEVALEAQPLVALERIGPEEIEALREPADDTLYIFNSVDVPEDFQPRAVLIINPFRDGFYGKRVTDLSEPLVTGKDEEAALMRFVDFGAVSFLEAMHFEPTAGARTFVESFEKPLIFGSWPTSEDAGAATPATPRWLVLAFDLEKTDLVFRTAFPILLGNLVQSLRPSGREATAALPGPVETSLAVSAPFAADSPTNDSTPAAANWWNTIPLWWWAAFLGALWLLLEWGWYQKRATE